MEKLPKELKKLLAARRKLDKTHKATMAKLDKIEQRTHAKLEAAIKVHEKAAKACKTCDFDYHTKRNINDRECMGARGNLTIMEVMSILKEDAFPKDGGHEVIFTDPKNIPPMP